MYVINKYWLVKELCPVAYLICLSVHLGVILILVLGFYSGLSGKVRTVYIFSLSVVSLLSSRFIVSALVWFSNFLKYLVFHWAHSFMELSPSWEAANCELFKNFPAFYGTRRLNTVFTRALHWSLSRAISIQSTPSHLISLTSKIHLILFTHLRLGPPNGLFPACFLNSILYAFLFAPFVIHALPISSSLTSSFSLYLENSTSYEAPHYAVFSNLLSPHLTSSKYSNQHPVLKRP
jgi:hypothetical protein